MLSYYPVQKVVVIAHSHFNMSLYMLNSGSNISCIHYYSHNSVKKMKHRLNFDLDHILRVEILKF